MARFDLFSKRQRDIANAGEADVYQYDTVPANFRIQLLNIAGNAFGEDRTYRQGKGHVTNPNWIWIDDTYTHERGLNPLGGEKHLPPLIRAKFSAMDDADALDLVDLIGFRVHGVDQKIKNIYQRIAPDRYIHIDEINFRMREARMGYQFEEGRLTRVDSQFIHGEIVKPALVLLSGKGFAGAQQEFLAAHQHYRLGQNKEAVQMAGQLCL